MIHTACSPRRILAGLALAGLVLLTSCGDGPGDGAAPPTGSPAKVALIGIDGITFDVIDPLLAAGKLPNMAALIERGARVVLESFPEDDSKSPVLWATIATSTPPEVHGITNFSYKPKGSDSPVIFASSDRKVPALWNLVHARGGTSGVVAWWNTWPAEAVDGYVVSDRFARSLLLHNYAVDEDSGLTSPPELMAELQPLVREPDAIDRDELARLGTFSDAEWEVLLHRDDGDEPVVGNGLVALKYGYQATLSAAEASLHLLRTQPQPDLFCNFLELPDRVGHHYWHAWEPDTYASVPAEWVDRWGNIVPGSYELMDEWIGRFLAELDEDTTVFVVSDHGMMSSRQYNGSPTSLGMVGHSGTHHRDGVLLAAGPAIQAGATGRMTLFDVAPTVLTAMGLPASTQFRGRAFQPLFDPRFLAAHPPQAPWDDELGDEAGAARPAGIDDQYLREMQAIGYLGNDGTDKPVPVGTSVDEPGTEPTPEPSQNPPKGTGDGR